MKIVYRDEYGTDIYSTNHTVTPSVGHTVIIGVDEYTVKDILWVVDADYTVIELTQHRSTTTANHTPETDRLNVMRNAILATNKRYDDTDKKQRALGEQIGTIRRHINQKIQRDNKET